jgi:hypothetical protein
LYDFYYKLELNLINDVPGDVNEDGLFSIKDVNKLIKYIVDPQDTSINLQKSDANCDDNEATLEDIYALIDNIVAGTQPSCP